MILEVRAILYFNSTDEARDFYHDCELAYDKSVTVNPDSDERELPVIQLIENHHDEDPNIECALLQEETPNPH